MPRERKRRKEGPVWKPSYKGYGARVWEVDGSCSGWQSLGTDNEGLANERLSEWVRTGTPPVTVRGKNTFQEEAERILKKQIEAGTLKGKLAKDRPARLRTYVFPSLGHLEVRALEPSHVTTLLDTVCAQHGKSEGTLHQIRCDISQILAALVREGALVQNVARTLDLPQAATSDTRERMRLSDAEYVVFFDKRGWRTQLDLMVCLCRCVAAHRTSDIHAGDWGDVDLDGFSWMKVRRPKTDEEVGIRARRRRRTRSYQKVAHEIPEEYRAVVRMYWERAGKPAAGPIFPNERPGVTGTVKWKNGRVLERKGGALGARKGGGHSYAKAYRQAVWECGIYSPLPGFDPSRPDKALCRYQTDTAETRKLSFHGIRGDLITALHEAGVDSATRLAIAGHTQETTQTRHYVKAHTVRVPKKALPGARPEPEKQGPAESGFTPAQLAQLAALLGKSAPSDTILPSVGRIGAVGMDPVVHNPAKCLVRPKGLEPLTSGLETHGSPPTAPQVPESTPPRSTGGTAFDGVPTQGLGGYVDPLASLRQAAADAALRGDWELVDQLRALLAPKPTASVHNISDARRKKR